ncbi:MAG: hypothetical protein IKF07_05235 [Eubacterium sp.]|nr:hypothetical protein [Eubacterium sp.]
MLFYEFDGLIADEEWAEGNENRRVRNERSWDIAMKSDEFNRKLQNKGFIYVSKILEDSIKAGVLCYDTGFVDKWLAAYLKAIGLELKDISIKETTIEASQKMLQYASRNDLIDDDDDVLGKFDLDFADCRYGRNVNFSEFIIDEADWDQIYKESESLLANDTFIPELCSWVQTLSSSTTRTCHLTSSPSSLLRRLAPTALMAILMSTTGQMMASST